MGHGSEAAAQTPSERTTASAPTPQGPGLGNITYTADQLFEPFYWVRYNRNNTSTGLPPDYPGRLHYGSNLGIMVNGYFMTLFAPDAGQSPGGFLLYDVSNPASIRQVKRIYNNSGTTKHFRETHSLGVANIGGRLYVAIGSKYGVEFWDFTDINNITQVSKLGLPGVDGGDYSDAAWQLFWQAPYLYVAAHGRGLYVVDASNPGSPRLADRGNGRPNPIPPSELGDVRVGPVFVVGNHLVVSTANRNKGVVASLDLSDPLNPAYLDRVNDTLGSDSKFYATCFDGQKVYTAPRGPIGIMRTFDLSDPAGIVTDGRTTEVVNGLYCATQDDTVFVGGEDSVFKIDVSGDTAYSKEQVTLSGVDDQGQISFFGNIIYVGNDHGQSPFLPHNANPDETPPVVVAVSPRHGATRQALTSRIGIAFSDAVLPETLDASTIRVLDGDNNLVHGVFSVQSGLVNLSPFEPLDPNTTYRIEVPAGGVSDYAGNRVALAFASDFRTDGPLHDDHLVHHWPLLDNARDRIGRNHGTVVGGSFASDGGLELDGLGLSGIHLVNSPATLLGGSASVAFHLATRQTGNAASPASAPGLAGYLNARDRSKSIFWGWIDDEGKLRFSAGRGAGIASPESVNDGTSRHFVLTRDADTGELTMYQDGLQVAAGTGAVGLMAHSDPSGGWYRKLGTIEGSRVSLSGTLKDIRVFDTTLDDRQTRMRFSAGDAGISEATLEVSRQNVGDSAVFTAVEHPSAHTTYRWDFDDGTVTESSTNLSVSHTYTAPGHYRIRLIVTTAAGATHRYSFLRTVTYPPTDTQPTASTMIAGDSENVYNVNPDNGTVTAINRTTFVKAWETPVGKAPRTLALDASGNIWVAVQENDKLVKLDDDGNKQGEIDVGRGSAPFGVAFVPGTNIGLVTLQGTGEVAKFNAVSGNMLARARVNDEPRGIAISGDGAKSYVTQFRSTAGAVVTRVDTTTLAVVKQIELQDDTTTTDAQDRARGRPNYLNTIVISPDGRRAWLPSKKDNIFRGESRDGQTPTHETTVRAIVSQIDLASDSELFAEQLDIDNRDSPRAVAFSPKGDYAFVTSQGNNSVEIIDTTSMSVDGSVLHVGFAPQGIWIDDAEARIFVYNFTGRSVAVYDIADTLRSVSFAPTLVAGVTVVGNEGLGPETFQGLRIFYNAADGRMSQDGYISCATCHVEGGQDGTVWDFTDRGEGLRNTISLKGRGGDPRHGNIHWTANFDEIQDFENDIRYAFKGTGFLSDAQFETTAAPLGATRKAGLNPDLDALATYVHSLGDFGRSPHKTATGNLTEAAQRGRRLFSEVGCNRCHTGPVFTDARRHDVGTIGVSSGVGLDGVGFETPTLLDVGRTPPYFHDGSMATLAEVVASGHGTNRILSETEQTDSVAFLQSLEEYAEDTEYVRIRQIPKDGCQSGNGKCFDVRPTAGAIAARYNCAEPRPAVVDTTGIEEDRQWWRWDEAGRLRAFANEALCLDVETTSTSTAAYEGRVEGTLVLAECSDVPRQAWSFAGGSLRNNFGGGYAADARSQGSTGPRIGGWNSESKVRIVAEPHNNNNADQKWCVDRKVLPTRRDDRPHRGLSTLTIEGLDLSDFDEQVLEYAYCIPESMSATRISAVAIDAGSTVTITDRHGTETGMSEVSKSMTVTPGLNRSTVEVTRGAVDQSSFAYTVSLVKMSRGDSVSQILGACPGVVPVQHLGPGTVVVVHVHFSEAVSFGTGSFLDSLHVEGATVLDATPVDSEGNLWAFRLVPTTLGGQIVFRLKSGLACTEGGACTEAGRKLSNPLMVTIEGERSFELAGGNDAPRGMWGNGETLWVADYDDAKLYAYLMGSGDRLAAKDIDLVSINPSNTRPTDVWSDGETWWVTDDENAIVYAYRYAAGSQVPVPDAEQTIVLATNNGAPTGLWGDGETIWVADSTANKAFAYRLADGSPDSTKDLEWRHSGNDSARGLWSNGTTVWVADDDDDKVYSYAVNEHTSRRSHNDLTLDPENADPSGLGSNGHVMWVADAADGKVYSYELPSASSNASLTLLKLSDGDLGAFSPTDTSYTAVVADTVTVTTLTALPASGASVEIDVPDADEHTLGHQVQLPFGDNVVGIDVTAADGTTTRRYEVAVLKGVVVEIVTALHPAEVVEGTAAPFTVTLGQPREHALEVLVNVTETGAMLGSGVPASVTFAPGQTSAPLSVPTVDDAVAEEPSTVTVALESGAGYWFGAAHVAQVTVRDDDTAQDDDEPAFAVTAMPSRLVEGESATVTVAITNGVTYTERQQFSVEFHHSLLELSHLYGGPDAIPSVTLARLASALDYTVSRSGSTGFRTFEVQPSATAPAWRSALLSLEPGESSMTVTVTAEDDAEFELDETLLMVVERIGTTDEEVARGALTILDPRTPAPEARVVSVEAGATPVAEGTAAAFTVRLDRPAFEALEVALAVSETGAMLASDVPASVTIAQGERSATLSVPTVDDAVVEGPGTVTVALESGAGYAVGASAVAQVTVEDGDTATFSLSATPSELVEGESTTVTLAITNGVTFASDQYFKLAQLQGVGMAGALDVTDESAQSSKMLILPAGADSVETTVTTADDAEDEAAETLTFEARPIIDVLKSKYGEAVGRATVTILADDATLDALSLSGIDIGAFSSEVTAYTASVPSNVDVASTEVTATATDAGARVEIVPADADAAAPGHQVALAERENEITVMVTAADGVTQRTYTVTVTRAAVRDIVLRDGNSSPRGLWGDGETVWVADSEDGKLYAYALADGSRVSDKDFDGLVAAGINRPTSLWSDGKTLWVADDGHRTLYAYRLADKTRDETRDVVLETSPETSPGVGLWGDGETLWVLRAEPNYRRTHAYALADGRRDRAKDNPWGIRLFQRHDTPYGLWSDGTTAWAANSVRYSDTKVFAFAFAFRDGVHRWRADIALDGANIVPRGLWSNGELMWVSDTGSGKLHPYALPRLSSNASLTLLELSDGDLGTFSPTDTSYTAVVVADTVTVTTLTAQPASGARVEIDVPDAEAHTPGHQVALAEGENAVTVTVTAADGVTQRSYTVTVTRAATEPPLTARLVGMPASHDGTSAFRFELALSEEIRIGYRTVRDAVFTVTGGAVSNARRLVRGSNLRWEVTVTPSGSGPVDIVLPAERACTERGAICTAQGKRLSSRVEAEVAGPASGSSSRAVASAPGGAGTSAKAPAASPSTGAAPRVIALAEDNGRPAGLWSDGERLWVANAEDDDRRLYAYRLRGGARESTRDIVTDGVPRGLWSDGETVWVSTRDGGGVLEAYRLSDGARDAGRDVRLEGRRFSPAGLWSDGTTLWAVDWLAATARAYRLGDGTRDASRDVATLGPAGNWMAFGMWSDGETMWVSDQGERVYAYHMADGTREPARELAVGPEDWDPMGVWSDAEVMWMSGREALTIRVRELPPEAERLGSEWTVVDSGADAGEPTGGWVRVPDAALRGGIEAALGKGSGEAIWRSELAGLEVLDVRGAGVVELGGLEHAVGLRELDLSFNAVGDLAVLSSLPALERLHLDGAVAPAHLGTLSGLVDLRALSVRSNGLEDLSALRSLRGLRELDVGDNRLVDLEGVAGLSGLTQLRADRNRLGALRGVESLTGLRALDVSGNAVGELSPLANLSALRRLTLTDNAVAQLHELSRLAGLEELGVAGNAVVELEDLVSLRALRRLDVRGNPIAGVGPLAALPSLEWVHVGGCGIADFTALDGRPGLTVEGRSDQSRP